MNLRFSLTAGLAAALASELARAENRVDLGNNQPPSLWQQDTLSGNWLGLRPWLAGCGVDFSPSYIGEVMSCVDGGTYGAGTVYDHNLILPLTVDLEKLAGWNAATFYANAIWIAGDSLSAEYVGDYANVSNISASPAFRVQELWLRQGCCGQKLLLQLGLIAADSQFFGSDAAALFINGTFGAFTLVGANLPNPPIYPMASPGASLRVQPTPEIYFQTAVFDGDSGTQNENPHGLDFPLATSNGALFFFEAGITSPIESAKCLSTTLKTGAFLLTKRQASWNSQTAGRDDGGRPNYGIYGVFQQDLLQRDNQVITAFFRAGHAPAGCNVVDWYADAGFNCIGWVPGRKNDAAGLAIAYSHFSHNWRDYERNINSNNTVDREIIIEATYSCQLMPWWTLQPDFQYAIAPGGSSSCNDAIVIGLRTILTF